MARESNVQEVREQRTATKLPKNGCSVKWAKEKLLANAYLQDELRNFGVP